MTIQKFDAYEISPVSEDSRGNCMPHEVLSLAEQTAREDGGVVYWTLYGHLKGHGVQAIGDFTDYESVAEVYSRITGHVAPENPDGHSLVCLNA